MTCLAAQVIKETLRKLAVVKQMSGHNGGGEGLPVKLLASKLRTAMSREKMPV